MILPVEVLAGAIRGGTSILYAAIGESVAERAGIVNLGTEGSMLAGALASYAVAAETGSAWAGIAAGAVAGGSLALVHAFFVITRRSNALATGLVVLFLGLGLTSLFGASYVSALADTMTPWKVPVLGNIPWIGVVLFRHDPLVYCSYVLIPLTWMFLFRTRSGLVLRSVGERSDVVASYGLRVTLVQYLAVVAGGMFAGIGGAHLSTAYTGSWFENMVQGRGFVAVAVVIFAARHPLKVAGGSYLFGAALALSPALQARGYGVNQFALNSLPYLAILIVLIVLGKKRAADAPEGLRKVFELGPTH
jgi:general nucleoside transport system permease protein